MLRVESGPADRNNRQDIPLDTDKIARVPRVPRPLSRHCSGRRFGGFLRYFVSSNNHVAVKWRHCFNWKPRTQNGERLRRKRERNEYGCTFHVPSSYPNPPYDGKLIFDRLPLPLGLYHFSHHHMMMQATTEVVSQSRSWPRTTRRWRRTKMADSRRIGSASAPQMQTAK